MSNLNISPAAAITVTADTPLSHVVLRMRERNVGSILVLREAQPHDLIGIFSERDLVRRVEEIVNGNHWNTPIGTLMMKPVKSITIYELEKAGAVMVELGIRHLPVIYRDENSKPHLAGVVSMRDLFRTFVEAKERTSKPEVMRIACIANEDSLKHLAPLLAQGDEAEVNSYDMAEVLAMDPDEFHSHLSVVLDLDSFSAESWSKFLRNSLKDASFPPTVLLYDPAKQDKRNISALGKLSGSGKLTIFAKPVNIIALLRAARGDTRDMST